MQIQVCTISGRCIDLDVAPDSSVADLKLQLQEGILENQRLFFSDLELDDSKSLAESGLEEGVVLQLVVQSDITIRVRTLTGRMLSIQVDSNDTVEHLMSRLEAEDSSFNSAVGDCALMFSGQRLVSGKISGYGIKEGSELVAIVRHRMQ